MLKQIVIEMGFDTYGKIIVLRTNCCFLQNICKDLKTNIYKREEMRVVIIPNGYTIKVLKFYKEKKHTYYVLI